MEPAAFELILEAMRALKPMAGVYHGLPREFCPHAVGAQRGVPHVFTWQFGGRSSHGKIPAWRCFALEELRGLRLQPGRWWSGDPIKGHPQSCLDDIVLAVDPAHTTAWFAPGTSRTRAPAANDA